MNRKWIGSLAITLAILGPTAVGAVYQARALKTEKELRSYALGMDLGTQLRKLSIEVDPAVFGKGLSDALAGRQTAMTAEEAKQAISRMQTEFKNRQILPQPAPKR